MVSPEQRRLMTHALGIADHRGRTLKPYRNRFATYLPADNCGLWIDLCRKGLAEHYDTAGSGMMFFAVTLEGHVAIGVTPENS